jgi:hypothetical protein
VRRFRDTDASVPWALTALPKIGETADPTVPITLPAATETPANFPDLADIEGTFLATGEEFLVAELDGHLVVTGGFRPLPNIGETAAELAWTLVYYVKAPRRVEGRRGR